MSSETITRNDLTAILNEVLPFSFTEFRYHNGTITIPNSTLTQVHSETFENGSWLILTTLEITSGGVNSPVGQNRILENGALIYAHKDIADNSIVNTNFYVLQNASNTTITLEAFQASGNSQTQEWKYTAIRIGDKFAQGEADYIVEQGTDGIWTYRKWASGIAECWANFYDSTSTTSHEFNGNYPFAFVSEPCLQATGCNVAETDGGVRYAKTTATDYDVYVKGSWNHDAYCYIYAIGRWK